MDNFRSIFNILFSGNFLKFNNIIIIICIIAILKDRINCTTTKFIDDGDVFNRD